MVILELNVSTELLPNTVYHEQTVLDNLRIEAHLVFGDRIDERCDELVERVEKEGHVHDEGSAETFGVMSLKNVKDLIFILAQVHHTGIASLPCVTGKTMDSSQIFDRSRS